MSHPERTRKWTVRLLTATFLLGAMVLSGCYHPHYRHRHHSHGDGWHSYERHDGHRDRRRDRRDHHRRHHRDHDHDRRH